MSPSYGAARFQAYYPQTRRPNAGKLDHACRLCVPLSPAALPSAWPCSARRISSWTIRKYFEDPLAAAIAGPDSQPTPDGQQPYSRAMRAFLAVRCRYAEDLLAAAVERGVRQYVVLGAGLDTFAYRYPWLSAGLHVFEVDHPATQDWKREQLRQAGIAIPDEMTFAAVNFERQSLDEGLAAAGFSQQEPAFFSWLGVTPYLSRAAFDATSGFIARMPLGSGVVFDYAVERSLLRVARAGEPFRLFFDPAALAADLARLGFADIEDLNCDRINARYFAGRSDGLSVSGGGHLLSAWTGITIA